jgi:hypothetical protein
LLNYSIRDSRPWAVKFALDTKTEGKFAQFAQWAADAPARRPPRSKRSKTKIDDSGAQAPAPEFVHKLDRAGECVRTTIAADAADLRLAAQKLGVARAELLDYLLLRPELQAELGDNRDELLDHAEAVLRSEIEHLKAWAICFVLLTLGRSRGYVKPPRSRWPGRPGSGRAHTTRAVNAPATPGSFEAPPSNSHARTEAKLRVGIQGRNRWVVRFVLLNLGQSRGYCRDQRKRARNSVTKPAGVFDPSCAKPAAERAERDQFPAAADSPTAQSQKTEGRGQTTEDRQIGSGQAGKQAVQHSPNKPLDPVWREFLGGVYSKLRPPRNRKRRRR